MILADSKPKSLPDWYPIPKSPHVTKTMKGNKKTGTKPELLLRKALWSSGIRGYRLHCKELPGKPDLCFRGKKLVVFVHGCYWHRCPSCAIAAPRHNEGYWSAKLQGNQDRDVRNKVSLEAQGWSVLTLWECEIKREIDSCVRKVQQAINDSRQ